MADFEVEHGEPGVQLKLPPILDLAAAEGFLAAARGIAGKPCDIDGSAVARFSTPCAQVLIAFLRSGDDVKLVSPSEELTRSLTELGLMDEVTPRIKS